MSNKKILMIKPPYFHMPLGLAYVLRSLENAGIAFDYFDAYDSSFNAESIIRNGDYSAIATGGLSANYEFICDLVKMIRKVLPRTPFILGGNVTKDTNPAILFDKTKFDVDFAVIGEAETSFPYLVKRIFEGGSDFSGVPGIIYRNAVTGEITRNIPKRFDLTAKNVIPAWEYINVDLYKKTWIPFLGIQSMMPIVTGRGCVGTCSFCSPTIGAFRKRPLGHVFEEIDFLLSHYQFDLLMFLNEMFYDNKEDVSLFCQEYKKHKVNKPWFCALRADSGMDVETFKMMKDAGCVATSAGIESGSDKILKAMKKNTTNQQIREFYRNTKEAQLPCFGTFIVGSEEETESDLIETIDMVIKEEMVSDACLMDPYPGTLAYKNAIKRGLIKDEWYHLTNVSFGMSPYSNDRPLEKYVNISDIPQDKFLQVLYRELRRFNTFFYQRYRAKDVKQKRVLNRVKVSGVCPECGSVVYKHDVYNILGQKWFCCHCFAWVSFDYYTMEKNKKHFQMLCDELKKAKSILVVGTCTQAYNLLRYDHFSFDYNTIMGFLDIKGTHDSGRFCNYPKYSLAQLKDIVPEKLLIVDDEMGDAEIDIRRYYMNNRIQVPTFLHILPDHERPFTQYIKALTANKYTYNMAVWIIKKMLCMKYIIVTAFVPRIIISAKSMFKRLFGQDRLNKIVDTLKRM